MGRLVLFSKELFTRCDIGKAPSPTVAIIDSQLVKTTELADSRGFDAHKKIKDRKRHIVTDTIGIPLRVKVTDANISDNQVAIIRITTYKTKNPVVFRASGHNMSRRLQKRVVHIKGKCKTLRETEFFLENSVSAARFQHEQNS